MLVLTRKSAESFFIGDTIKITVVEVKGGQVRIGIEAPATIKIFREELYRQILEENTSAAGSVETLDSISADIKELQKFPLKTSPKSTKNKGSKSLSVEVSKKMVR
jgi:carbon storage regulator